ncbi:MAG: hypothetical protein AAB833_02705 [Patescibacteria group bacterium]
MTVSKYVGMLSLGTLISGIGLIFILFNFNPTEGGPLSIYSFYTTLGFFLVGFFTTIGTIWGGGELSEKDLYRHFARSLRQGLLLSGAMVLSLYLLAVDLFSLFTMTIVISLVIFLEVVFLLSDARQEK